jgi:non-lysosomal glucosylceramidase
MHLSVDSDAASATAAWADLGALLADFADDGTLSGPQTAGSPAPETTVDAALAAGVRLAPGEEQTVTFVLSWYFPGGTFGHGKRRCKMVF